MMILVRHAEQHSEAGRIQERKKYLIVIEGTGYSAYSPDLDGCVATGKTREEVEREMQGAIAFHLEGMRRSGEPIPEPHTYSAYVGSWLNLTSSPVCGLRSQR
jgi:predicted RNase H-like HicB family nuclease